MLCPGPTHHSHPKKKAPASSGLCADRRGTPNRARVCLMVFFLSKRPRHGWFPFGFSKKGLPQKKRDPNEHEFQWLKYAQNWLALGWRIFLEDASQVAGGRLISRPIASADRVIQLAHSEVPQLLLQILSPHHLFPAAVHAAVHA